MSTMTLSDAVGAALAEEMQRDPTVLIFGEGVATKRQDLVQRFGAPRVRNTPLAEGIIAGTAVGAAGTGLRPVIDLLFAPFMTLAMDELVNSAGKLRYISGGQFNFPLVTLSMTGAGWGVGGHHNHNVEAWFVHAPGLKVVMPSNAADAKGLLKAAIRDPNPVVFLEHEMLYGQEFDVPEGDDWTVPIGKAKVRRTGRDVTLVAYSRMVGHALQAAELLAAEGIEAEVVDLRTIRPMDTETIVESVRRTNRLVTVEEGWGPMGVGAEVAARVVEHAFDYLDAPPARVCQEDVPLPYAANLEGLSLPSVDKIVKAAKAVCYR